MSLLYRSCHLCLCSMRLSHLSRDILLCHVFSGHATARRVASCPPFSCYAPPAMSRCHVTSPAHFSCHLFPCHVKLRRNINVIHCHTWSLFWLCLALVSCVRLMSCPVMPKSCHLSSCHAMSCRPGLCHALVIVILCIVMPCRPCVVSLVFRSTRHVLSPPIVLCHGMSCNLLRLICSFYASPLYSCHVMVWLFIRSRTISCRVM